MTGTVEQSYGGHFSLDIMHDRQKTKRFPLTSHFNQGGGHNHRHQLSKLQK